MLYHPDDPLVSFLRDGYLGGITLGSPAEELYREWGEPTVRMGTIHFYGTGLVFTVVGFSLKDQRVHRIQLFFGPRPELRISPLPPAQIFSSHTSETVFLQVLTMNQLEFRRVEIGGTINGWETDARVVAGFEYGFLDHFCLDSRGWYNR